MKQAFLDDQLTTSSIAQNLETNRNYLSQVVNEKFGKTFCNYINDYRIREAKIKLSEGENIKYTIEYIAHSVEFRSVNAFNKAFKKNTGVTPSFYIKSLDQ